MGIEPVSARGSGPADAAVARASSLATIALVPLIGAVDIDYAKAWNGVSPDYEILFRARAAARAALGAGRRSTRHRGRALSGAAARCPGHSLHARGLERRVARRGDLHRFRPARHSAASAASGPRPSSAPRMTLLLVMSVASQGRRMSSFTLLLAGVTINSIAMALILFFHSLASFSESFAIIALADGRHRAGRILDPGLAGRGHAAGGRLALLESPRLEPARGRRGMGRGARGFHFAPDDDRLRGGSFLAASVTSFAGPIGFVGLIVPHALRMAVRRRSPAADSDVVPVGRRFPRPLRHDRAHRALAGRDSRGSGHRAARRPVLYLDAAQQAAQPVDLNGHRQMQSSSALTVAVAPLQRSEEIQDVLLLAVL